MFHRKNHDEDFTLPERMKDYAESLGLDRFDSNRVWLKYTGGVNSSPVDPQMETRWKRWLKSEAERQSQIHNQRMEMQDMSVEGWI